MIFEWPLQMDYRHVYLCSIHTTRLFLKSDRFFTQLYYSVSTSWDAFVLRVWDFLFSLSMCVGCWVLYFVYQMTHGEVEDQGVGCEYSMRKGSRCSSCYLCTISMDSPSKSILINQFTLIFTHNLYI